MSEKSENETSEMEKITVLRDGKRPLKFRGEKLAEASSYEHNGPTNSRWDEYDLYRSKSGKYILSHSYYTRWQGESATREAWVDTDPVKLLAGASEWMTGGTYDDGGDPGEEMPSLLVELAEEAGIDISVRV